MAGAAVVVLLEKELLGNTAIPILCNLWRRLVLTALLSRQAGISSEVESSLSSVSFNYENQSLGLH